LSISDLNRLKERQLNAYYVNALPVSPRMRRCIIEILAKDAEMEIPT